jgi:hypothetical protein
MRASALKRVKPTGGGILPPQHRNRFQNPATSAAEFAMAAVVARVFVVTFGDHIELSRTRYNFYFDCRHFLSIAEVFA